MEGEESGRERIRAAKRHTWGETGGKAGAKQVVTASALCQGGSARMTQVRPLRRVAALLPQPVQWQHADPPGSGAGFRRVPFASTVEERDVNLRKHGGEHTHTHSPAVVAPSSSLSSSVVLVRLHLPILHSLSPLASRPRPRPRPHRRPPRSPSRRPPRPPRRPPLPLLLRKSRKVPPLAHDVPRFPGLIAKPRAEAGRPGPPAANRLQQDPGYECMHLKVVYEKDHTGARVKVAPTPPPNAQQHASLGVLHEAAC